MASFFHYKVTPFTWHKVDNLYQIDDKFTITFDDHKDRYIVTILPGFRTDGGSIPKIFQWFVKGWTDDYVYNSVFVLHDALYSTGCVHRLIADDMLRSGLRDIGMDRLHASTVCWCVNTFAANHYGQDNDENDNADFVRFQITEL